MATYLCREFVRDLIEHSDPHFASRVLGKIMGPNGEFVPDADDHRFQGIEGGWIRYVSRKNTAFRAIFLRRGADIYWYRAGYHSIEDGLRAPSELTVAVAMGETPDGLDALAAHQHSRYLKSSEPRLLREVIASRILIPHSSVSLVTPRLSPTLFSPTGLVGRLVNSVIELEGTVTVITKPPKQSSLDQYRWLVSRGVDLLIHQFVNARVFLFEVNRERLDPELAHLGSIGVIGSAELTELGLGLGEPPETHEELSYEIAKDDFSGSERFLLKLAEDSLSLQDHIQSQSLQ